MKNKKLQLLFLAISLTASFLTGCGDSGQTQSPDAGEGDISAQEPAGSESEAQFSFTDISNLEFWFGSGAGAWRTVLTIHDDGTFEGEYSDSDMGSAGEDHPNGVCYLSDFTGKLTEPEKVNDYTYSVRIERIELAEEPDTEEIKDGIKYIYSEPYGLDDAEELLFYLPGAPVQELPEGYRSWMMGYGEFTDTQLPFYGLYNVKAEEGFSSHEKS